MNWMRRHVPPTERAIAFASDVLPTPGTSSMRRWPSANRHTSARWIARRLPRITDSIWLDELVEDVLERRRVGGRMNASERSVRGGARSAPVSSSVWGHDTARDRQPPRRAHAVHATLPRMAFATSGTADDRCPASGHCVATCGLGRARSWRSSCGRDSGAVALRQALRIARPSWWRRAPFLPLPERGLPPVPARDRVRRSDRARPADLVAYLEWCRERPDAAPAIADDAGNDLTTSGAGTLSVRR